MKSVCICIYGKTFDEVNLSDILNEVADSICDNFGAGSVITSDTVETPFNPRSTLYCDWTSIVNENTITGDETDYIVIDAGEEVSDYQMAHIVKTFRR